jgi:histidine decarboxylase
MWKKILPDNTSSMNDYRIDDFKALLRYVNLLASHKLGYPVSLLTYLGVVNNSELGIKTGSLANILLNNVGDPFKDSETSLLEVKKHERKVIAILERYFGLAENEIRGYVTTGGTEGNFAGLWWSKRYLINKDIERLIHIDDDFRFKLKQEQDLKQDLAKIPNNDLAHRVLQLQKIIDLQSVMTENRAIKQQLLTPTVFYTKDHTHYSIPKISEILHLNIRPIDANHDGSMNLDRFKKELLLYLGAFPASPIIVIANIGTTITGAIDDVPKIKKILDATKAKLNYTIHMDGALTGFVLPILKPFGEVDNYFESLGVNTLAFSAHKYPGLSQPCGIILARRKFFDKAFEKNERKIDYVGNISDVTVTGSRSGLNVLMFYNALHTLELDKSNAHLKAMVEHNIEDAKYLYDELVKIYGEKLVYYPFHFNVMFPKPSVNLAKKYQLMITGPIATICVLTNVTRPLIDEFLTDLKLEKDAAL